MEKINKLSKDQETIGHKMDQLVSKLKREAPSRESTQYYEDSGIELEKSMEEAKKTHETILEVAKEGDIEKSHTYFKTDYFEQINKVYKEGKRYIKQCTDLLNLCHVTNDDPKQVRLLKEQEVRMAELQEILNEATIQLEAEAHRVTYNRYIKDINNRWDTINNINVEIKVNEIKFTHAYFTQEKYKNLKIKYWDIIDQLEKKVISTPASETVSNARPISHSNSIKLPPITIPYFDGKYEDWTTFQDIFSKLIHSNETLSAIEKMQFLKTNVRGEASKTIQHFQICEVNYEMAWTQLRERYDNKRLIANKLINKIIDLPDLQQESAEKLKNIYYTITECLEAIKLMKIDTSSWGPIISCIVSRKWDSRTRELYESSLSSPMEVQKFSDLQEFLLRRFQTLEATSERKKTENFSSRPFGQQNSCKYCKLSNHNIHQCLPFKALTSADRFSFVKDNKLCINCLNHDSLQQCTSASKCRECQKNHNTLLHRESYNNNGPFPQPPTNNSSRVAAHVTQIETENVLLATMLIKFRTVAGTFEYLRALVDPGSQAAFITEEAASLLGLPRQKIRTEITGLGAGNVTNCKSKIQAVCKPRVPSDYFLTTDLLILPTLTKNLPESEIPVDMNVWQNKVLADPTFFKTGPIDAVFGAKEYHQFLQEGIHKTDDGLLGQNTEFGWIIFGSSPVSTSNNTKTIISMMAQIVQEEQSAKVWEMDDVSTKTEVAENKKVCVETYQETTKKGQDGKCTVNVPFDNVTPWNASRSRSVAHLLQIEKRLSSNSELDTAYKLCTQEDLDLGHMENVPRSQENKNKYYITHQAQSKDNPADAISRGMAPSKIQAHQGPQWLENDTSPINAPIPEPGRYHWDICRKSTKQTAESTRLTTVELGRKQIIQIKPQLGFKQEISHLSMKVPAKNDNNVSSLNPGLDQERSLRVGGRSHHSLIPYSEKHPIIIAGNTHISRITIRHVHKITLHGGNQVTLAQTRTDHTTCKISKRCNGNREDIRINKTGIITISQNCIIIANKIIKQKRNDSVLVIASFARLVAANLTTSTIHIYELIQPEGQFKMSHFDDVFEEENNTQPHLQERHWKSIHHKSLLTSSVTAILITLFIVGTIFGSKWAIRRWRQREVHKSSQATEAEETSPEVELKPLRGG